MAPIAVIGLMLSSLPSNGQILTGAITDPANGHQYYLTVQTNWTGAEAIAVSLGGHLATIENIAENSWIFTTFSDFGGQPCNLWTGLSSGTADGSVLGNYFWADGSISAYQNFAPSEPNYPDEHYVYLLAPGISISGMWNNWYDGDATGYTSSSGNLPVLPIYGVVEVVPEPSWCAILIVGLVVMVICPTAYRKASRFWYCSL